MRFWLEIVSFAHPACDATQGESDLRSNSILRLAGSNNLARSNHLAAAAEIPLRSTIKTRL